MALLTKQRRSSRDEFSGRKAVPLGRREQAFIIAAGLERFSAYAVLANCTATYSQVIYLWQKAGIKLRDARNGDMPTSHEALQKLKAPTVKVLPPEFRKEFVAYRRRKIA